MPRSRAARDVCIRSEAPWMKRRQHNRPGGDQPQPTVTDIPASVSVDEEVLQKAAHLSRELTVRLGDEGAARVRPVQPRLPSATREKHVCVCVRTVLCMAAGGVSHGGDALRIEYHTHPPQHDHHPALNCSCVRCSNHKQASPLPHPAAPQSFPRSMQT